MLQYKIIDSGYFLDRLEEWEALEMLNNIDKTEKNEWERARMMMYIYSQSLTKKKLKPTDIIKFQWENEEKKDTTLTKELSKNNKERLQKKAQWIKKNILKNNGK